MPCASWFPLMSPTAPQDSHWARSQCPESVRCSQCLGVTLPCRVLSAPAMSQTDLSNQGPVPEDGSLTFSISSGLKTTLQAQGRHLPFLTQKWRPGVSCFHSLTLPTHSGGVMFPLSHCTHTLAYFPARPGSRGTRRHGCCQLDHTPMSPSSGSHPAMM